MTRQAVQKTYNRELLSNQRVVDGINSMVTVSFKSYASIIMSLVTKVLKDYY
ncbi:hypothetical protein wTpre_332 [Wolbachia endosymbiont of Trichogramma pretiosum]|nr:hypothetical protein wTpre_332 [Wolbachia endosymbiont of Trichogramma pretiosum]